MWIRSQDRLRLLDIKAIYVCANKPTEIEGVIADTFDDLGFPLGTYKSKERALEVLDEIQIAILGKVLIPTPMFGGNAEDYNRIETLSTVYEMPKEEE